MPALQDLLKKINLPELELDDAKKKILLIYAGVAILVLAAYVFLFLKPSLTKLFDVLPKVRERKVDIRSVRNDLTLEHKLKARLEDLGKRSVEYDKKLSRESELPVILENISKIARSSRVKILSLDPQKEKSGGKGAYLEVPIVISAQSGYHELGMFISRLENSMRYMRVFNIYVKTGGANSKRHAVRFTVHAYVAGE